MSHKITLWPSSEVIEVAGKEPLLQELKKAGFDIKSSCGGCASCSDCIIVVKGGEDKLTPQTFEELRLLGNIFHITKERLSCQTKVTGDVVLDISRHEGSAKSVSPGAKRPTVVVRKKETLQETDLKSQEKDKAKPNEDWYRHWEKDKDAAKPKHLGGGKRPRPFTEKEAPINSPEGDEE